MMNFVRLMWNSVFPNMYLEPKADHLIVPRSRPHITGAMVLMCFLSDVQRKLNVCCGATGLRLRSFVARAKSYGAGKEYLEGAM